MIPGVIKHSSFKICDEFWIFTILKIDEWYERLITLTVGTHTDFRWVLSNLYIFRFRQAKMRSEVPLLKVLVHHTDQLIIIKAWNFQLRMYYNILFVCNEVSWGLFLLFFLMVSLAFRDAKDCVPNWIEQNDSNWGKVKIFWKPPCTSLFYCIFDIHHD